MLCEICQQREATVHTQKVINGVHSEQHICAECAAKQEHAIFQKLNDPFFDDFFSNQGFNHWFQPMFEGSTVVQPKKQAHINACPTCGTTWELFQKQGLLGCKHCYEHFADLLPDLLRRVHGHTAHIGKCPNKAEPLSEKETMQQALQEAIKAENFEEAARLRDALKGLQDTTQPSERGEGDVPS